MSFILDALKKADAERQLGVVPTLSTVPVDYTNPNRRLVYWSIAALILSISVLSGSLIFYYLNRTAIQHSQTSVYSELKSTELKASELNLQPSELKAQPSSLNSERRSDVYENETPSSVDDQIDIKKPISVGNADIIRPNAIRREALQEAHNSDQRKELALVNQYQHYFEAKDQLNAVANEQQALTSEQQNIIRPQHKREQKTLQDGQNERVKTAEIDYSNVKNISELSASMRNKIPPITISTHIFSGSQSFRSATINGVRCKMGAVIAEGLVLEAITEEGVVFSMDNEKFQMTALEIWRP